LAHIDHGAAQVSFCGVGNIGAAIYGAQSVRQLVSHNGTLGHEARKIAEFVYPWTEDSTLVMSSDGLSTKSSLDRFPGIHARHPALAAALLYRDFARTRDDTTVVVFRQRTP
jgi:hypothetical protein